MTGLPPRLYILDVDGTLRWTTTPGARYPVGTDEWRLMPGVRERLSAIPWSSSGPWLAIASNQCGIGDGLLSAPLARQLIADCLVAAIGWLPAGVSIDFCSCREGASCRRQKPEPGLLLDALGRFGVCPGQALYVGDLDIDRLAAERAGVPFIVARDFFGLV